MTLDADKTVTATFESDHYINLFLNFQQIGYPYYSIAGGSVVIDGVQVCSDPNCAYTYAEGQTITLQAIPYAGSRFMGWNGVGADELTDTCTITIDQNYAVDIVIFADFWLIY